MNTISKVTVTRHLDTDYAASAFLPIQLIPPGQPIAAILIRKVSPTSQDINIHFGASDKDGMPVYQGETISDDADIPVSKMYDAGLWYSLGGTVAPAAGSLLVVTVIYGGN